MTRSVIFIALILGLAAACSAQQAEPRLISVTGTAELSVDPDKVEVSVGIVNRAPTAAAALAKNRAAEQKLVEVAHRFNLSSDDIDVGYVSLDYNEKTDKRPQAYFEADQQVSLTLHDLNKYGAFLTALVDAGANRVRSVSYEVSNVMDIRKKVRAMAIHAAHDKAEHLAQEGGVKVVRLHSINEDTNHSYGLMTANVVTKSGSGEYEGGSLRGKITISVSLDASYEIE